MLQKKQWQTYEEVATYLLNQMADRFGLTRFEGKQKVKGKHSGTEWEIDAKGLSEGGDIFIIVECRRYASSRQSQENVGSLAYRIKDTGAAGGIIVSPLGLQKGAEKVAKAENIHSVVLDQKSTTKDYFLKFLSMVKVGVSDGATGEDNVIVTKYRDGKLIDNQESGE
jgi:hypothetical protein